LSRSIKLSPGKEKTPEGKGDYFVEEERDSEVDTDKKQEPIDHEFSIEIDEQEGHPGVAMNI
jgi:hypothetical protein